MKLIILDRDGVINHDSDKYIKSAEEWVPLDGSIPAIAQLSQAGYTIAVATNQSGIARGLFDLDALEAMHRKMSDLVGDAGGTISGIFYCAHAPDTGCDCRKPAIGLLRAIERELDIPVSGAPFIGDSTKDIEAARAAGCLPMIVRTGKGQATIDNSGPEFLEGVEIFDDLQAAAKFILNQPH